MHETADIDDATAGTVLLKGATTGPASLGTAGVSRVDQSFGPATDPGDLGRLGPYRVVRLLGQGAMGAVYAAIDTRLNRKVALKLMLPSHAADSVARQRFLREARAAAAVAHDHIVTIYEADVEDGKPFISMQFLEGQSLDHVLKMKEPIPLRMILQIGLETARGLEAAHAAGLIHRDVKPANLWLEGPQRRIKILDFGLAKSLEGDTELTNSCEVLGTPAYMSPEQARGLKVDARSDLFSLGSVLYRACSGKLPFDRGSIGAVLIALGTEAPPPLEKVAPHLPPAVSELIHRLMAKSPEERPQSAGEVATLFTELLQQAAVDGACPSGTDDTRSLVQITASPVSAPVGPVTARERSRRLADIGWWMLGLTASAALIGAVILSRSDLDVSGGSIPLRSLGLGDNGGPSPALPQTDAAFAEPAPAAPSDTDRAAAEWLVERGGVLLLEGQSQGVRMLEDLPQEAFRVSAIKLRDMQIVDEDLVHIGSLGALSFLDLSRTPIDGSGLRHLRSLSGLKILNISETRLADEHLHHLEAFSGLGMLDVNRTAITDQGLASLGLLQGIESINLEGTQVTAQGVASLRGLLPNTTIHWTPPSSEQP